MMQRNRRVHEQQPPEPKFDQALHHPSCTPYDRDLVWHCSQCGLNELAEQQPNAGLLLELVTSWRDGKIPDGAAMMVVNCIVNPPVITEQDITTARRIVAEHPEWSARAALSEQEQGKVGKTRSRGSKEPEDLIGTHCRENA
jgi:hypothetical protein